MSCEAIADFRESILDTKKFANMLQNETSSSIPADFLSSCNSFRTADQLNMHGFSILSLV